MYTPRNHQPNQKKNKKHLPLHKKIMEYEDLGMISCKFKEVGLEINGSLAWVCLLAPTASGLPNRQFANRIKGSTARRWQRRRKSRVGRKPVVTAGRAGRLRRKMRKRMMVTTNDIVSSSSLSPWSSFHHCCRFPSFNRNGVV